MPKVKLAWEEGYKHHTSFDNYRHASDLLAFQLVYGTHTEPVAKAPAGSDPYITALYDYPLLTIEGERALFLQMNCAKYKASKWLDPKTPLAAERLARYRKLAYSARNTLANHNLRLVINIVRRQPVLDKSVEELVSDGNMTLLAAIDQFDVNRPNRFKATTKFSTYACFALIRNFIRDRKYSSHFVPMTDAEVDEDSIADYHAASLSLEEMEEINHLLDGLEKLTQRSGNILRARHGIGRDSASLSEYGREIGLTKERVRQLEINANAELAALIGAPPRKKYKEYYT